MSSLDTVERAKRWLDKLSQAYEKGDQQGVEDNLCALLVTAKSIPDHLLEDANQKWNIGIPINSNSINKEFNKKATDGRPKEFKIWLYAELGKIKNNPTCKSLMDKRNVDIHRRIQRPDSIRISMQEGMGISERLSATKPTSGAAEEECVGVGPEKMGDIKLRDRGRWGQKIEEIPTRSNINFYFQDLNDANVLEASKTLLDSMKSLVELAHARFLN